MDSKSPATASPASDTARTKVDTVAPVTVTTTATPENVTASVAISTDTEWRITIQNSDGTKSEVMLSPVSQTNPTRQEIRIVMPGAKVKEEGEDAYAEKNPKTEEVSNSRHDIVHLQPNTYIFKKQSFQKSRKMRIYVIIQQSLTAIFSIVIIAVMALTLAKYNSTKNIQGAWPTNPLLTPTIVLLIMACLTCIADIITILVHLCSVRVVERMMRAVAKIRAVMGFLQAIATAAGTGYFRISFNSSGNNDLWGWSCSDAADAMASVNSSNAVCQNNVWLSPYYIVELIC